MDSFHNIMESLLSFAPTIADWVLSGKLTNAVKELFTNPKHVMGAASLWALEQAQKHSPGLAAEAKVLAQRAHGNFTPVAAPVAVSSTVRQTHRAERLSQNEALIIGCEPIADVSWPYGDARDALGGVIDINPATWTGTRAAAECMSYTRYQIEALAFTYVPRSGTQTPGVIAFGTMSESPLDSSGTIINQLMASPGGVQTPVWSEVTSHVNTLGYGMKNYPLDDFSAEPQSPLRLAWSTDLSAVAPLGTLWCRYKIKLSIGRSPSVAYTSVGHRPWVVADGQTPNLKHIVMYNGTTYITANDGAGFQGIVTTFHSSILTWGTKAGMMLRLQPYQRVELLPSGVYAVTYRAYLAGEDVTDYLIASLTAPIAFVTMNRLYSRTSTTAGVFGDPANIVWGSIPGPLRQTNEELAMHVHFMRMALTEVGGEAKFRARLDEAMRNSLVSANAKLQLPNPLPPSFPNIGVWQSRGSSSSSS